MKRALITGVLGQDGSYLAEYLLALGYEVWGACRSLTTNEHPKQNHVVGVNYQYADLRDPISLEVLIIKCQPDEIYNLGAQVFVPTSWRYPDQTFSINVGGLANILTIVDNLHLKTKVYQASSSEMFGNAIAQGKQSVFSLKEDTPMNPVSPYGVSKYASHKLVEVYRQKGLFVCSGILGNHESPRRGLEMVTRKITRQVAAWVKGDTTKLRLGNGTSKRDWGFAGDYVEAMYLMLQHHKPDDYVIGTGEAHSVHEFFNKACVCAGISNEFSGDRTMFNAPEFMRSNELYTLVMDSSKARSVLGWKPRCTFDHLVEMMVNSDIVY